MTAAFFAVLAVAVVAVIGIGIFLVVRKGRRKAPSAGYDRTAPQPAGPTAIPPGSPAPPGAAPRAATTFPAGRASSTDRLRKVASIAAERIGKHKPRTEVSRSHAPQASPRWWPRHSTYRRMWCRRPNLLRRQDDARRS